MADTGRHEPPAASTSLGSGLTSLRVLEVLSYTPPLPQPDSPIARAPCTAETGADSIASVTAQLIRSTASTLRTLSIVSSGTFTVAHVRGLLLEAGQHLHYISLLMQGQSDLQPLDVRRRSPAGVARIAMYRLQPVSIRAYLIGLRLPLPMTCQNLYRGTAGAYIAPSLCFPRGCEAVDEDGFMFFDKSDGEVDERIPADFDFEEDEEMETEMLRNMVEGLCITLREPARVLAHAPGWGEEARRQCRAALPDAYWLR